MGVSLGLLAALFFGSGDFFGGRASRDAPTRAVLVVSQTTAAIGAVVLALVVSGEVIGADLTYGAAAGLANALGLGMLYRGLATGRMGVVAPVTAVVGAVVPVTWGLVVGERPGTVVLAGVVIAVLAGGLISRARDIDHTDAHDAAGPRTVLIAIVAGAALGTSFVLFARTSDVSGMWPVLAARTSAMLAAMIASRWIPAGESKRLRTHAAQLAIGAGLCDVLATAFLLVGIRNELAVVVAPIASLAPGFTVVWAWSVLREPLGRTQGIGLVLALVGLAMIAGG